MRPRYTRSITISIGAALVAVAVAAPAGERKGTAGERGLERSGIEGRGELLRLAAEVPKRIGADRPGQLMHALRAKRSLARGAQEDPIPGSGGHWTPYGTGPLRFDSTTYPAANGDGFGRVNGRVNDLFYAPQTKKLYAAVAQGGLWESADVAQHWKPIGDGLPIGSTGAVTYTPAGGGTLLVATGDHAFSNDYGGVGVFWSTDDGDHWTKAAGAPDGALSYRLAADPTKPGVVYYASSMGLYRSTDAGRSFVNVVLPTGECAGDSHRPNCFFANIVTDVAIQPKDDFGHTGGAVLAAVGWRNGRRLNFAGKPEAPANGLYRSENGTPGSFQMIPDSAGFTPSERAGRVELGVADGPGQNSGYVYAIAQDAVLFSNTLGQGGENDLPLIGTPSVLDAIYVSGDFGQSWTQMESRHEFFNPANGSALSQLTALGIAPGYQVTYNQWIKPDPLRQVNGVPTRVLLGMEEVWQTALTNAPQLGHSQFQAFGQYTANGGACLVIPEQCGAKQQATPTNTTTHPDQHGAAIVPDESGGGETLVVGNDGGTYVQHVAGLAGEYNQLSWGSGANEGFHTLLPYGAAMAKDGTVFAGLQDNGELKITPGGEQFATYVGDGTFALVEPDNSKIAYDELPNGGINVTTDGGTTWTSIAPNLTDADFVAPMVMDPGAPRHIMTAGRDIVEKTDGPDSASWTTVFDLGTRNEAAGPVSNHATAAQVIGDDAYVGFCGSCDPVKLKQVFHNGIATNVGGALPGKRLTRDGWHVARATGLPERLVTSVAMDPADHRTVYVTLAASAARYWAPIGSQGEDTSRVGRGHVYKSTDAGRTFHDISADLPDVQATWVIPRGNQLIVATAIGAFASQDREGTRWAPLGDDLPPVAVYSMQLKPGDESTLVAATYGRGVYTYRFADRPVLPGCRNDLTLPTVRVSTPTRTVVHGRRLSLRGTAHDRACGAVGKLRRVQVSVVRKTGRTCRWLTRRGHLGKPASCRRVRWITARGTRHWRFRSRRALRRGTYIVRVRAVDRAGNVGRPRTLRVRVRAARHSRR